MFTFEVRYVLAEVPVSSAAPFTVIHPSLLLLTTVSSSACDDTVTPSTLSVRDSHREDDMSEVRTISAVCFVGTDTSTDRILIRKVQVSRRCLIDEYVVTCLIV